MRCRNGIRVVVLLGLALASLSAAPASGQTLVAPFDGSYTVQDLGQVPGVPDSLGGLTLKAGTTDRLLIGGQANDAAGALYEIGVVRDGAGHIVGFSGSATRFARRGQQRRRRHLRARAACSSWRAGR